MTIELGPHEYGKAEIRLVWFNRDTARHQIRDRSLPAPSRSCRD